MGKLKTKGANQTLKQKVGKDKLLARHRGATLIGDTGNAFTQFEIKSWIPGRNSNDGIITVDHFGFNDGQGGDRIITQNFGNFASNGQLDDRWELVNLLTNNDPGMDMTGENGSQYSIYGEGDYLVFDLEEHRFRVSFKDTVKFANGGQLKDGKRDDILVSSGTGSDHLKVRKGGDDLLVGSQEADYFEVLGRPTNSDGSAIICGFELDDDFFNFGSGWQHSKVSDLGKRSTGNSAEDFVKWIDEFNQINNGALDGAGVQGNDVVFNYDSGYEIVFKGIGAEVDTAMMSA